MQHDSALSMTLYSLLPQIPVILVNVVALILCLVYWGRHPRAALCAFLGFGLLLGTMIVFTFIQSNLILSRHDNHLTDAEFAGVMRNFGIVWGVVRAVGSALVVAAVFVGRGARSDSYDERRERRRDDDDDERPARRPGSERV